MSVHWTRNWTMRFATLRQHCSKAEEHWCTQRWEWLLETVQTDFYVNCLDARRRDSSPAIVSAAACTAAGRFTDTHRVAARLPQGTAAVWASSASLTVGRSAKEETAAGAGPSRTLEATWGQRDFLHARSFVGNGGCSAKLQRTSLRWIRLFVLKGSYSWVHCCGPQRWYWPSAGNLRACCCVKVDLACGCSSRAASGRQNTLSCRNLSQSRSRIRWLRRTSVSSATRQMIGCWRSCTNSDWHACSRRRVKLRYLCESFDPRVFPDR